MIKVFPERICGNPIKIGSFIPQEQLKETIIRKGNEAGIPLAVMLDDVKVGKGITSISAKSERCVIVYNSQHRRDYYGYALLQTIQGNTCYLYIYLVGDSKNYKNIVLTENSNNFISSVIGGVAKRKQQEEYMYYDLVKQLISDVIASGRS